MEIDMKELLQAGAHFGHQKRRWNPKMAPYIYGERGGVHIFDLAKTAQMIKEAAQFLKAEAEAGRIVLFVGTKNQAKAIVREEAERIGMPYVTERWLGGMLTNWKTTQARIKKLKELERKQNEGELAHLTKKEAALVQEEITKMNKQLSGLKDLSKTPDALFVADVIEDDIAIKEAKRLGLPVVAIVDSNANPDGVDYVIPANDDAIKAICYVVHAIANAVESGKSSYDSGAAKKAEAAAKDEVKVKIDEAEAEAIEEAVSKDADKAEVKQDKVKE